MGGTCTHKQDIFDMLTLKKEPATSLFPNMEPHKRTWKAIQVSHTTVQKIKGHGKLSDSCKYALMTTDKKSIKIRAYW